MLLRLLSTGRGSQRLLSTTSLQMASAASASTSSASTPSSAPAAPTFTITTPIYYVNDSPHVGHAYTTVSCDAIARFQRLDGKKVWFVTGTDEHGQKVEASAKLRGMSPESFVDDVSGRFRALADLLQVCV